MLVSQVDPNIEQHLEYNDYNIEKKIKQTTDERRKNNLTYFPYLQIKLIFYEQTADFFMGLGNGCEHFAFQLSFRRLQQLNCYNVCFFENNARLF